MASRTTNTTDAKCTSSGEYTAGFNQFVANCRTATDTARANTFFSSATQTYKDVFQNLRDEYTNLITMGNAVADVSSLAGTSTSAANRQISDLTKKMEKLQSEVQHYRRIAESADKTFLEDIYYDTPKQGSLVSLQDIAIFVFLLGWFILGIALVSIRLGSPGGGLLNSAFVMAMFLLVTLCVYGLLQRFA